MSDEKLQTPEEPEEDEAGWAYRYGQEARLRAQIEARYLAAMYDMGVIVPMFKRVLTGIAENNDDWIEGLANYVDQLHDCGCHLQQLLGDPIGIMKESEELTRVIDAVKGNRECSEDLDAVIDKFLKAYWKANNKAFDEWISNEGPAFAGYKERRDIERKTKIKELLPLFLKLLGAKGLPPEVLKQMMGSDTIQ